RSGGLVPHSIARRTTSTGRIVNRGKGGIRNPTGLFVFTAQVNRHHGIRVSGNGRNNRQRIQQCPRNQCPTIEHQGSNNTRNCDGGANRLIQPAFLKPDFFVGEEVGGDSGERDGKIFNTGVAENI